LNAELELSVVSGVEYLIALSGFSEGETGNTVLTLLSVCADYDCDDKTCGSDGCGGVCGTCNSGSECSNQNCVSPNESCSSAISFTSSGSRSFAGTVTSRDADVVTTCGDDDINFPLWYSFTVATAGSVTIDTAGSNFDTVLAVFSGSCGSLTCIASSDDTVATTQSEVTFTASTGTSYVIAAGSFGDAEEYNNVIVAGNLALKIVSQVAQTPSVTRTPAPTVDDDDISTFSTNDDDDNSFSFSTNDDDDDSSSSNSSNDDDDSSSSNDDDDSSSSNDDDDSSSSGASSLLPLVGFAVGMAFLI